MTTPSDISIAIYGTLKGVISTNVFDTYAPSSIDPIITELVVYKVGSIRPLYDFDKGSAIRSYIIITCLARNKANGIVNTAKLKAMTDSVYNLYNQSTPYRMSLSSIEVSSVNLKDFTGQSIIYNIIN